MAKQISASSDYGRSLPLRSSDRGREKNTPNRERAVEAALAKKRKENGRTRVAAPLARTLQKIDRETPGGGRQEVRGSDPGMNVLPEERKKRRESGKGEGGQEDYKGTQVSSVKEGENVNRQGTICLDKKKKEGTP